MKDDEINSESFHNSSARIVIFFHFFLLEIGKEKTQMLVIIIIIMTLLDNTITGRTSSSHCGPLKLQIQIAKTRSKNTVKN